MKPNYREGDSVLINRRNETIWAHVVSVGEGPLYPVTIQIGRQQTIVAADIVCRPEDWPGYKKAEANDRSH